MLFSSVSSTIGGAFYAADPRARGVPWFVDRGRPQEQVAVGQNQWYQFGIGAPSILVYSILVGMRMFTTGTGF